MCERDTEENTPTECLAGASPSCLTRDNREFKIATGTARLTCSVISHAGGIPIQPSTTPSAPVLDGKKALLAYGVNV